MSDGFEKAKRSFERSKLEFERAGIKKLLGQNTLDMDFAVTVSTDWSIKIHLKIPPTILSQLLQAKLDEIDKILAAE